MKAVGQHLQPHLSATLHRVRASSIFAEPAQITPEELAKDKSSFDAIVDVREEREFNNGHIEGTRSNFQTFTERVPKAADLAACYESSTY